MDQTQLHISRNVKFSPIFRPRTLQIIWIMKNFFLNRDVVKDVSYCQGDRKKWCSFLSLQNCSFLVLIWLLQLHIPLVLGRVVGLRFVWGGWEELQNRVANDKGARKLVILNKNETHVYLGAGAKKRVWIFEWKVWRMLGAVKARDPFPPLWWQQQSSAEHYRNPQHGVLNLTTG